MLSVLVPYRPDNGYRDRAWAWLDARYQKTLPEFEMIVSSDQGGLSPGQFNHPLAINRAAEHATGDVFLIADADTAFDPEWVTEAVRLVASGEAPWVLPQQYVKITRMYTEWLLDSDPACPIAMTDSIPAEWIGYGVSWAGLVVVPRAGFETVGGYDERYAWWGPDDSSFGLSMDTLHGPHVRLPGAAFHLWHPQPISDTYHHGHFDEQRELAERYQAAAGDVEAMTKVRFG